MLRMKDEIVKINSILRGKKVLRVFQSKENEIGIEFEDGTRFFIDLTDDGFEFSIT